MRKQTKGAGAPAAAAAGLRPPVVVLVNPQLGENIGTAARAMANFGLTELRLVAPRDGWPNDKAVAAAAAAAPIVHAAQLFDSTREAVADLHYVAATTARPRDLVKPVLAPDSAAREMDARCREGQRCGLLFGPEKSGMDNDTIALADAIVTAPVDPVYPSLNLAQAVLLMGYEWRRQLKPAGLGRQTEFDGPAREGLRMQGTRPAKRDELVGFFDHLEAELDRSGFLYPPEKRPAMVRNLRSLFLRLGATEQDVRTLRGIVSSLAGDRRGRGGTS